MGIDLMLCFVPVTSRIISRLHFPGGLNLQGGSAFLIESMFTMLAQPHGPACGR
ncbi:MAG: hypothetical protein ACRC91_08015 [Aeromonas sp.]